MAVDLLISIELLSGIWLVYGQDVPQLEIKWDLPSVDWTGVQEALASMGLRLDETGKNNGVSIRDVVAFNVEGIPV